MDGIPEAEPVHFGGHALLRWAELAQKAVHWDEVGRWASGGTGGGPWTMLDKAEHFWMIYECFDWEDW